MKKSKDGHQTMTITTFLRNIVCLAETNDKAFRLRSFAKMMKPTFGTTKVDFSVTPPIEAKLLYRFSMEYLVSIFYVNLRTVNVFLSLLCCHNIIIGHKCYEKSYIILLLNENPLIFRQF